MNQGQGGGPRCRPVDGWPGPSRGHPGGWHLAYAQQLSPAGGEGVLAGGQALVPGSGSACPQGLSCHMPVSVLAVKPQMGCGACPG